jgi:O-Antigen ligase
LNKIIPLFLASAFLGSAISWGNIYLFHLAAVFAIIGLFLQPKTLKAVIHFNWIENREWIFIVGYSLLSIIWATDLKDYMKYNAYLICGYTLFFITPFFLQDEKTAERSKNILINLFYAHLVLSLLEIATPLRWPISEYSNLNIYFGRENVPFFDFFENYPTSFFWHQNNCALVTLMGLPFIIRSKNKFQPLVLLVAYFVIFLSGTKSIAILSLLYGIFQLVSSVRSKNLKRNLLLSFMALVLLFPVSFYMSNQIQKDELKQAGITLYSYVQPSFSFLKAKFNGEPFDFNLLHINIRERYYFMDAAIELYKTSPLLGIGAGSHLKYVHHVNGTTVTLDRIHNYWLEFFMVYGPFVSLIYGIWIFKMVRKRSAFSDSLVLFILGVTVIATATYFLPKWLLYSVCAANVVKFKPRHNSAL